MQFYEVIILLFQFVSNHLYSTVDKTTRVHHNTKKIIIFQSFLSVSPHWGCSRSLLLVYWGGKSGLPWKRKGCTLPQTFQFHFLLDILLAFWEKCKLSFTAEQVASNRYKAPTKGSYWSSAHPSHQGSKDKKHPCCF